MSYIITPERKSFLEMINWAEGSPGYDQLFNYVHFNNNGPHPNQVVTAGGYSSTAAGAYQFLYSTWHMAISALGLPDIMSPENQDQAALYLIDHRGALGDVDSGDIKMAINKCSWEWASLPVVYGEQVGMKWYEPGEGRYGQPTKNIDQLLSYYYDKLDEKKNPVLYSAGLYGFTAILLLGLLLAKGNHQKW